MFKKMLLAAGLAASSLFAGCATTGSTSTLVITPQQLITDFCPTVNADLKVLSGSTLLSASQQATVAQVLTINTAVCAAGASVNLADLQSLNATLFPALITLVSSIPGIPNQPAILLGLTLAQPVLAQAVAAVTAASSSTASSASTAAPATATAAPASQ